MTRSWPTPNIRASRDRSAAPAWGIFEVQTNDRYAPAVFEGLRARLEKLLRDHSRSDPRAYAASLREALLEAKVGIGTMRSALAATERELVIERRQLADAERRGRLAADLPDAETVTVAERFAARHRERVLVLERKLVVQRDELRLAEREVTEMLGQYRAARPGAAQESIDAAWRDLAAAGAERPDTSPEEGRRQADLDRMLKEQAVEAQLAFLKRKVDEKKRER